MKRLLSLGVICLILAACGGSSGDSHSDPASANPINNSSNTTGGSNNGAPSDLNPTTLTLESPPIDGKLPADLLPPV